MLHAVAPGVFALFFVSFMFFVDFSILPNSVKET